MSEPSRRGLLRTVAAAGAGAIACTAVPSAQAAPVPKVKEPPKMPYGFTLQSEWRWCSKCAGLFFAGNDTKGVCPDGKEHDAGVSGKYVLRVAVEKNEADKTVQGGWRRCKKCEGLFYANNNFPKVCPAGKDHDPDDTDYLLAHTTAE
jgi:hypothetical protein